jgi:diacylglycerol kinase (ATP)
MLSSSVWVLPSPAYPLMKQHAKIIVNPAAGAGSTHRKWPEIRSLLQKTGFSFDSTFTEERGHAIEIARTAAADGYRYLVAVGGDGTIHEVANGLLQTPNSKEIGLGAICTGTGSDLSRSVGIPHDYRQACLALTRGRSRRIDGGLVSYQKNGESYQRYFLNYAGIGFDAAVTEATEKLPKYFGGTIPYLFGLLRTFLRYRNKEVVFRIADQAPETATALSIVVANGGYFGGGMHVAPEATLDDGLFDILIIGDFGKLELLRVFPRIYKGTHLSYPKVRLERSHRISIESSQRLLLHADGEVLGEGPISLAILPGAVELIV